MTSVRYLAIADQLAGELKSNDPGSRVPSENEIAVRFGVGRAASRSALQELERRLVVRRIQGSGTFVNRRIDYVISGNRPPSWHATVTAAGARPRAIVKAIDQLPLPEEIAEYLGHPPGAAMYRVTREFYADELLASWVTEWIPVGAVPELETALHVVDSLDLVLRQTGSVAPVRAWCRVGVELPPPEVLVGLGIASCQLAWRVESLSCDRANGRPIMFSCTWTRLDAVRVVVEMDNRATAGGCPPNERFEDDVQS
ncbi:phosphonate metabolism protein PhnF [Nocardia mangyaensis]|uniref:Phosphonate metabolism protein PhnF n=1 Tax=Nocardia mangyaensis TaxID=2213200 RepID=A0A1J0VNJ4_9NOCA|nr:GntR family transcriptional regulator [Nocardia mangyaensis]APE33559.1 phosphonate metabolism protein PhnF [Nocardia mangyaensis]